ncbi:hypothetical protein F3Y22_tig00110770pilonHSYRG00032 [Hibiscus syriacus]|uniref:Ribosome biogenesis protein NOP53 n=1 Tax=Hibiscus syriacus TaxID=106335 RepID=A0A6A2ZSF3_HIBSY|nr:hypothetical protein F3Y22_tig00110770pilonHSYRG00032 [Hibiscus syriacus]
MLMTESTKDALSGGSLTSAPTESLFVIDKSKADLSVKKKIEKKREKILRVDSMLKKNPFVEAIPSSKQKCSKKKKHEASKAKDVVVQDVPKDGSVPDSGMVPIWGDGGQHGGKSRRVSKQSIIPAGEDSLAQAVAEEMQKGYKIELGPQPVPLTVMGEVVDEDDDNLEIEKRPLKTKRVTLVELNKRARRKELQKREAEAKKKEELTNDIDNIPDILQEIAKEEEEKQKKRLRRTIAKQERLKACPPRLGKYKFQPAPTLI